MRRKVFTCRGADFLLNGLGSGHWIFGSGNGSSDNNVSCASLDGFGGSHDTSLISVIGPGGPHTGIDDQKILSQFCAQGFYLARRADDSGATSIECT